MTWLGKSRRVVHLCLFPNGLRAGTGKSRSSLGRLLEHGPLPASPVFPHGRRSISCGKRSNRISTFPQVSRLACFQPGAPPLSSPQRLFSSLPPHQVVGLPALSPTMEHGTIASWTKKEGDSFGPGDVICEIETDKAVVSFDAQDEGILAKILVQPSAGEVRVGQPIMVTVEDAANVAAFANFSPDAAEPAPPKAAAPSPAASTPAPSTPSPPPSPPSSPPTSAAAGVSLLGYPGRVFASPLAKTLAGQLGHDLRAIPGTGPNGRVLAADVREYVPPVVAERPTETIPPEAVRASAPAHASTVEKVAGAPIHGAGFTDYRVSEAGRGVAARLTVAKQTVPHYYLTVDLELDKLLSLRETLNKELGEKEMGLSVNDFLLKAAALASKKVPEANASWHGDFVRQYHAVDVNLVLGVGDGLLAPVIRNVDSKGLRALSAEVAGLVGGAGRGELSEEALQTGTFTLINVGMYGVKAVAPIVSLPQACVLGVGAIENRVVPAAVPLKGEAAGEGEGEVYRVVPGVTVTLSCDHRVIDGAVGAQWLSAFKSLVEEPMTLLL